VSKQNSAELFDPEFDHEPADIMSDIDVLATAAPMGLDTASVGFADEPPQRELAANALDLKSAPSGTQTTMYGMSEAQATKSKEKSSRRRRRLAVLKQDAGPRLIPVPPRIDGAPRTRAECAGVQRPCPFVACRHSLFADVMPDGELVLNYDDPEHMLPEWSCALDVAERGEHTLEIVGAAMRQSYENIRLAEVSGIAAMAEAVEAGEFE
jgi:hypothetical protein